MNYLSKICMALSLSISLSACSIFDPSDQEQIEAVVRENLIDPTSVLFGDFILSADGNRACIEYNAKNRMGGYTGQSIAEFKKQYGTWMVEEMDSSSYSCSSSGFKASNAADAAEDAADTAGLEAIQVMADALQKSMKLSEADAITLAEGRTITIDDEIIDCSKASLDFRTKRSIAVELSAKGLGGESSKKRAEIMLDAFNRGVCPQWFCFACDDEQFKEEIESQINKHNEEENIASGATEAEQYFIYNDFEAIMKYGEAAYKTNCSACHQINGRGIPGVFPAIAGSTIATGDVTGHLDIVINGNPGTAMQAFGEQLSAVDLAAIITYERNAFGNDTGDIVKPKAVLSHQGK